MPKQLLNRFLPTPEAVAKMPGIKYLGSHILAPQLWYINRRSISSAVFWGLLCAFFPVPMQMLVAAGVAIILGVNLPICVMMVWISNPLTIPPILVSAYWLGAHLLGEPMLSGQHILQLFSQLINWIIGNGQNPFQQEMHSLLWPLIVGLLIEALLVSTIASISVRIIWRHYVIKKWRQRCQHHSKKLSASL
jgi:uncharacterized protein (DUF2062 family)